MWHSAGCTTLKHTQVIARIATAPHKWATTAATAAANSEASKTKTRILRRRIGGSTFGHWGSFSSSSFHIYFFQRFRTSSKLFVGITVVLGYTLLPLYSFKRHSVLRQLSAFVKHFNRWKFKTRSSAIAKRTARPSCLVGVLYIFILFHQTLVAIIHRTYIDVHIH